MKRWVIPDIHGCNKTFETLLRQIKLTHEDTLFLLGDYIDRGPGSKQVIDTIIRLKETGYNVRALRGNHEEYFLIALDAEKKKTKGFFYRKSYALKQWMLLGGKEMLESFQVESVLDVPKMYVDWMESLEYYIELPDYFLVHAGFNFKADDIFADKHALLNIREFECDMEKLKGKKLVHGHVSVGLDLIHQTIHSNHYNFIDLDNGCVYTGQVGLGNLLAYELDSKQLIIQPNIEYD